MKSLAAIVLTLLISAMFVSMVHISIAMEMDMATTPSECPFMSHTEVLCAMNIADHIGAWKLSFTNTVVNIALYIGAAILLYAGLFRPPPLAQLCLRLCARLKSYTSAQAVRPLQELFADGILNPKVH
ncbi:hypothetical protein GW943_03115 [Candidatus Parcubacteria bacterium]|uniref:Uncharacterized protein n=1 Tax=Candidatus Kaiserbacteria bacterium CG10_big_fil_rev_8_21_14_0_10_47_16 TaxID=1974608 RepID=A0A2H0UEL6_9BACT|nr:hypothetical protein [Candidatus Parcubacteria bacterium]PIR84868.1 MAG: hypothetical protein COU16_00575 [Candidatus Kaiserbacteria bacterium CG10_big_fil_rev_8_21_14_0_10_47_16]